MNKIFYVLISIIMCILNFSNIAVTKWYTEGSTNALALNSFLVTLGGLAIYKFFSIEKGSLFEKRKRIQILLLNNFRIISDLEIIGYTFLGMIFYIYKDQDIYLIVMGILGSTIFLLFQIIEKWIINLIFEGDELNHFSNKITYHQKLGSIIGALGVIILPNLSMEYYMAFYIIANGIDNCIARMLYKKYLEK